MLQMTTIAVNILPEVTHFTFNIEKQIGWTVIQHRVSPVTLVKSIALCWVWQNN
jgi:hypothetical protein